MMEEVKKEDRNSISHQSNSKKLNMAQITQTKTMLTKTLKIRKENAMLAKRVGAVLTEELEELNRNPFPTVTAGPEGDDIMIWRAYLMGPENTPYFAGMFVLSLIFPTTYPRDPPEVTFCTSMYHPGVNSKNGEADPSSFGLTVGKGTQKHTIRSIIENEISFFKKDVYTNLNNDGIKNKKAYDQLINDPRGFHETAIRWTYQFAK
jgi:ubiquitin-protein ligase